MRILIAILGFNRPDALRGLLSSVSGLQIPSGVSVDLLLSLDGGGDPECAGVIKSFSWPWGKLDRVLWPENLGLREHVLRSGDRVVDYDALVMLEDDLLVSPVLLQHVARVVATAGKWPEVRQLALYTPAVNEFYQLPFQPVPNAGGWYARVPCSWGQCWTPDQWSLFRTWLAANPGCPILEKMEHPAASWSDQSWKKSFFEFLLNTKGWVHYPKESLTTNRGLPGEHFVAEAVFFKVAMALAADQTNPTPPDDCLALYDAWLEPLATTLGLTSHRPEDIDVDLVGRKPLAACEGRFLLTSRGCNTALQEFDDDLYPAELNIRLDRKTVEGKGKLRLAARNEVDFSPASLKSMVDLVTPTVRKEIDRQIREDVLQELHSRRDYKIGYYLSQIIGPLLAAIRRK